MNDPSRCTKCSSVNIMFNKKKEINICEDYSHEYVSEKQIIPLRIFLSYGHDANEELVRLIKADLENKLNPCIVAWDDLDEEIKRYDYEPVENIPELLGMIGYEVYIKL